MFTGNYYPSMSNVERILVIKLSALGDFVQAFGPFSAIRSAHSEAHITLLTTDPYRELAMRSPWFDDVWTDTRPKAWQVFLTWHVYLVGCGQGVLPVSTICRPHNGLRLIFG